MSTATPVEKTKALRRLNVPIDKLVSNKLNPNEMDDAQFNMLCANIELTGMTDPLLVRDLGDGMYRIVGGHHRWEAAKCYDFTELPCTVIDDPAFDEDQEKFQVVRMNVIRGKMSPDKFMKMYQSLTKKYADDVMAEAFGFVRAEEFQKLVYQMSKQLPTELQDDFKKAAQEIKTIDGLSVLLNSMFTKYGSTLPYGYMLIDYGGKESIWLRMSNQTRKALLTIGKRCVDEKRTIDDLLGGLVVMAATGKLDEQLLQLIATTPEVIVKNDSKLPTYESGV